MITAASDDDPSSIATYSQTGAAFGYSMAWVMLFTWPLMVAIQEISARIGRVTGHGIAGNIRRHYPAWLLQVIVFLLLLANIINLGADLGAMAEALRLLIGGPPHLYVIVFAVGCALLEVFVRYERYVSILKWASVSLFAYVATALVVDVPWARIIYHLVVPTFSWNKDYIVAIVAVLGTDYTLLLLLAVFAGSGGRAHRPGGPHAYRRAGRSPGRDRPHACRHLSRDGVLQPDQPLHNHHHRSDPERARHH